MPVLSKPTNRETQWADANKKAVHFMLGAQRMLLEEVVFAAYATLDLVRTETHLFSVFASKLGAAHSVQDWNAMGSECGQHQLEFIRRDSNRMLKQGERLIEATSNLLVGNRVTGGSETIREEPAA
jgi:hypothetical protein